MRSRRPHPDHDEAVSRRLALLSQELSGLHPVPAGDPGPRPEPERPPDDGHTRVRLRAVEPTGPTEPSGPSGPAGPSGPSGPTGVPVAPALPTPGRHAARRAGLSWVPGPLRGRVDLGPAQLAVVAVAVALGLAATTWWVARAEPRTVAAPAVGQPFPTSSTTAATAPTGLTPALAEVADPSAASPPAPGGVTGEVTGEVTVDVAGKVRRPGIVVLPTGARVVDALEAAGGARRGVDLQTLNLARPLVDGEQVLVGVAPVPGAIGGIGAGSGVPPGGAPATLVNLNTATQPDLESLPEVGPVTAQAILTWRAEHGGFTAVEELLEVDGIGEATLATVAPLVTV